MTIWKYELEITDVQVIKVPGGARFMTVHNQNEKACLWAMVEPSNPIEPRKLALFETGQPVQSDVQKEYLGTFQLQGGRLIFHLFELADTVAD